MYRHPIDLEAAHIDPARGEPSIERRPGGAPEVMRRLERLVQALAGQLDAERARLPLA